MRLHLSSVGWTNNICCYQQRFPARLICGSLNVKDLSSVCFAEHTWGVRFQFYLPGLSRSLWTDCLNSILHFKPRKEGSSRLSLDECDLFVSCVIPTTFFQTRSGFLNGKVPILGFSFQRTTLWIQSKKCDRFY